ncbi:MAG: hypothetical protein IPN58_09840 [Anaerolineales bacterium]|nr:hypothetical protein [Anaerolineales bacterium]
MCNGQNHPVNCDCGFGPKDGSAGDPLPRPKGKGFQGRIKRGKRSSWGEEAISNESVLRRGLFEIGVDKHEVRKVIRGYHDLKKEFAGTHAEVEREFVNRLKRLIGIRKYKIEATKTRTIKVPLFTFGAPPVPKSRVTYKESVDFKNKKVWTVSLIVPGIGMGASQEYETKYSLEYFCDAGIFKTVFAPIRVRICKLGIYEKGIRIKDGGLRITAEGGKSERNFQHGIKTCRRPDCTEDNALFKETFFDAGDDTKSISTKKQEHSFQKPLETSIGLNIFGIQTSVNVNVTLKKTVALQYDLPGGHDYHLYQLKNRHGITWKTSIKRAARRQRISHGKLPNSKNRTRQPHHPRTPALSRVTNANTAH